jgi:hypothetical protein
VNKHGSYDDLAVTQLINVPPAAVQPRFETVLFGSADLRTQLKVSNTKTRVTSPA